MKILPESFRKCISAEDRAKLNQHTIDEIKPKYESKLERELQKQIYSWLRLNGFFFVWSRTDKRTTGIIGTPDFVFPYKNYFVAVECKTETGKVTPEQSAAISKIETQGGLCYVVRSFDQFLAIFS